MRVHAGSLEELRKSGRLLTKVGSLPVVVFWDDGRAYAIEDRCPHMGFPLHQGTVESGLVTCHWHHARFDLASGCTLDPFADDARGFDVDHRRRRRARRRPRRRRPGAAPASPARAGPRGRAHARDRQVRARPPRVGRRRGRHRARRRSSSAPATATRAGVRAHRARGDGQPAAAARRRPTARSRSRTASSSCRATRGRSRRGSRSTRSTDGVDVERLADWYRRFVETRSADAAERALATAIADRREPTGHAVAVAWRR